MADLTLKRGGQYVLVVAFTKADGSVLPLTDTTVSFTIKKDPVPLDLTDATAIVAVDQTSHLDAANGLTTIPFTIASDTSLGTYACDIKVTFLSDPPATTDQLTVEIEPTVTQRTV